MAFFHPVVVPSGYLSVLAKKVGYRLAKVLALANAGSTRESFQPSVVSGRQANQESNQAVFHVVHGLSVVVPSYIHLQRTSVWDNVKKTRVGFAKE